MGLNSWSPSATTDGFPETFRRLALAGAEIVCVPTNWVPMPDQPAGEAARADVLHRAAAHPDAIITSTAGGAPA